MLFTVASLVVEISAYDLDPRPLPEGLSLQNDGVQRNMTQFLDEVPHCLTSDAGLLDEDGVPVEHCRDSSDKLCPVATATGGECKGTYCELWHSDESPSNLSECAQECLPNEDKKACFEACLPGKTWDVKSLTDVFVQMLFAMNTCSGMQKMKIPQAKGNFTTMEDFDCKETLIDLSAQIIAIAHDLQSHDQMCIRPSSALFSANYLKCRSELPGSPEPMSQEHTDFVFGSESTPHDRTNTDYVKTFVFDAYHELWVDDMWDTSSWWYNTESKQLNRNSRGNICVPIELLLERAIDKYLGTPLNAWGQIVSVFFPWSSALQQ